MMRLARRLRGNGGSRDAGITLVELMVAIVIFGFLLAMVSSLYISSVKALTTSQATTQGTGVASNVMNAVSRVIRAGTQTTVSGQQYPDPVFLAATGESLTMYSYIDAYVQAPSAACPSVTAACATQVQPLIVQITVDPTSRIVTEKRWAPTAVSGNLYTYPALTATPIYTLQVGGPIVPTPTTPSTSLAFFTYLDANGNAIAIPTGGLSCAQRATVNAVTLTVRVAGASASARPTVVLQNTVQLPNLGNPGATSC